MKYLGSGKIYITDDFSEMVIMEKHRERKVILKQKVEKSKTPVDKGTLTDEDLLIPIWKELSSNVQAKIIEALVDINNRDSLCVHEYRIQKEFQLMNILSDMYCSARKSSEQIGKEIEKSRLQKVAEPLVKLLQSDYDSHTTVLVENDYVTLRRDEIGIPCV